MGLLIYTKILSLIDEPVRLLKRRPILHTGLLVVVRFVYYKNFFFFYDKLSGDQSRPQQAELGVFGRL